MRWDTSKRDERRRIRKILKKERHDRMKDQWHYYFAWLPVRLIDPRSGAQTSTTAWLEGIARKARDDDGRRPWLYASSPAVLFNEPRQDRGVAVEGNALNR